jgi:hypothetical protein
MKCKCGRVASWNNINTWKGDYLKREYRCPKCHKPIKDCDCFPFELPTDSFKEFNEKYKQRDLSIQDKHLFDK